MKSHELSLIRAEGLSSDDLVFSVSIDQRLYGNLELKQSYQQSSLFLPIAGKLGLKVQKNTECIGNTTVDIMLLEQDGLQWLPILSVDSQPIASLPEEVPAPRILISLYSSRSKYPNLPIDLPSESSLNSCKTEEKELKNNEEKYVETDKTDENFGGNLEFKEIFVGSDKNQCYGVRNEVEETRKPGRSAERDKTVKRIEENELEDVIDLLKSDLDRAHKKNFRKKKVIGDMKLEILILSKKLNKLGLESQNEENLKEKVEELEGLLSDSTQCCENLQGILAGYRDSIGALEKMLTISTTEKCKLEKANDEVHKENSDLKMVLSEVRAENKRLLKKKCEEFQEFKGVCMNCEKHQNEIKGHLENTKRLYQTIDVMSEKLNTQEFHNQELMITNQDLSLENESLKKTQADLVELYSNSVAHDSLDELFQNNYPVLYSQSVKIVKGFYVIEQKKVKISKTQDEKLEFFMDGHQMQFSERLDLPNKHEKNSLSFEDISNQVENYKSQSLIHSRAGLRDNKLRVLAKQW